MLANLARPLWNKIVSGIGKASLRIGVTPDMWTFISLGYGILAAVNISNGYFWNGLGLSVLMLLADAADGATARAKGVPGKFGMVFDHVIDRYVEFILFSGLLLSGKTSAGIVAFSVSGILMASYVRAKAESIKEIESCTVGIAGRVEKLILTYLGIAFLALDMAKLADYSFFIVGLISHITAIQRLLYVRSLLVVQTRTGQDVIN